MGKWNEAAQQVASPTSVSHTVEGILGGSIQVASFTTGTGEPRVWLRTRDLDGLPNPTVTMDEQRLTGLISALVGAFGDARVKAALAAAEQREHLRQQGEALDWAVSGE